MMRAVFGILSLSLAGLTLGASPARLRLNDDHAEIRRKIRSAQAGTYIDDILEERDSSLSRWHDRKNSPLTIWIQPTATYPDFTPNFVTRVRQAFGDWDALNLPLRFTFVRDSSNAEVHVTWIDRFKQPISGRTRWSRDDDWWITDANIVLAVHHSQGEVLDESSMRAMALHEIGHLLGLDHTRDSMSVMAPKVRVRALSDADRATARLIYALPAGPLR
jgi:predicted Zn-dependent protease